MDSELTKLTAQLEELKKTDPQKYLELLKQLDEIIVKLTADLKGLAE